MNIRRHGNRLNGHPTKNPSAPSPAQNPARPATAPEAAAPADAAALPPRRTEKEVVAEYTGNADFVRARHTLRLEEIYDKAITGHERSCEDERIQKRTAQGDAPSSEETDGKARKKRENSKLKVETTTRAKSGDIRFLAEARAALGEIRRIWGIEAAGSTKDRIAQSISKIAIEAASDSDLAVLSKAFDTLHRLAEIDSLPTSEL
ncbi:MAG: hypothetical protein AB7O26_11580 [Planctomycetaceae bacterium]